MEHNRSNVRSTYVVEGDRGVGALGAMRLLAESEKSGEIKGGGPGGDVGGEGDGCASRCACVEAKGAGQGRSGQAGAAGTGTFQFPLPQSIGACGFRQNVDFLGASTVVSSAQALQAPPGRDAGTSPSISSARQDLRRYITILHYDRSSNQ